MFTFVALEDARKSFPQKMIFLMVVVAWWNLSSNFFTQNCFCPKGLTSCSSRKYFQFNILLKTYLHHVIWHMRRWKNFHTTKVDTEKTVLKRLFATDTAKKWKNYGFAQKVFWSLRKRRKKSGDFGFWFLVFH